MNIPCKFAIAVLCAVLFGLPAAQADFNATVLRVELGASEGDDVHWALPNHLTLKAGEPYLLMLVNWSDEHRHVVMAPEFENAVFRAGILELPQRVEIPGATFSKGIALPPGAMVEVALLPYKEGRYKLFCEDRVHTAAGIDVIIDVRH